MLFQKDEPMVHKVYYKQVDIVKNFLSFCVKPSVLAGVQTATQLKELKITDAEILPNNMLFVGTEASKIIKKCPSSSIVNRFLGLVREAYHTSVVYIIEKLPLRNKALKI